MGMTIDDAMENMLAIQAYYNDKMQDGYIGFAKEDNESVDVVMNTVRKYQDIQERIKSEMAFDNPKMDVKNLLGLARALEIFRETESEK